MKKKYEKPQVRMERFEMSVSVAACGWILAQDGSLKKDTTPEQMGTLVENRGGFATKGACTLTLEELNYFGGGALTFGSY